MCYMWILYAAEAVAVAGSTYVSYKSAKDTGEYNEQVAKVNAKAAENQAQNAEALGSQQADEQRMRTRLALGTQRAALAANNVELSGGTPSDILGDTALFGSIDERRIRANAAREAWGLRTQGYNFGAQGALARYQGNMGATSSLLTGLGQTVGGLNNAGVFGNRTTASPTTTTASYSSRSRRGW